MGINPVRKSSTFQRGGSHGALNTVFALKGMISSPRKRPEVLRGSSPVQPSAQRASGPEGAAGLRRAEVAPTTQAGHSF